MMNLLVKHSNEVHIVRGSYGPLEQVHWSAEKVDLT